MIKMVCAGLLLVAANAPAIAADAQPASPTDTRRTIGLSKVFADWQTAEPKGKYKTGNWCISHGPIKVIDRSRTEIDHNKLDFLFGKSAEAHGYKALNQSQDMFADAATDAPKAQFMLGANAVPDTINVCDAIGPKIKGTVIYAMEFQLFDATTNKVVGKYPVMGQATYDTFQKGQLNKLMFDALANGFDTLFASGQLDAYLGKPNPPSPAPAPTSADPAAAIKPTE